MYLAATWYPELHYYKRYVVLRWSTSSWRGLSALSPEKIEKTRITLRTRMMECNINRISQQDFIWRDFMFDHPWVGNVIGFIMEQSWLGIWPAFASVSGLGSQKRVHLIADGVGWIRTVREGHFPNSSYTLDLYHLKRKAREVLVDHQVGSFVRWFAQDWRAVPFTLCESILRGLVVLRGWSANPVELLCTW